MNSAPEDATTDGTRSNDADAAGSVDPRHLPLTDDSPSPTFHGWRLLGFITVLMLLIAGVSALLDILLLGWDR